MDTPKDIRLARDEYPATASLAYFNTAAVGLASRRLATVLHRAVDEWAAHGFDLTVGEEAGERARVKAARLMGAAPADVALIASVSAAAGMVAAQFGPAEPGGNVVIGEREYSSNHFPWRMLAARGYDVRQVPFRNGGLEPDEVAHQVDGGTVVLAVSAVQSASGHRTDLPAMSAIARRVGALLFVDGSQAVGALPVGGDLEGIDVLATSDHKFLLNAGRGVGYCYLSSAVQDRFRPVAPGWKAGRTPLASFFGPEMDLSPTASRFDNSIGWLAALGDEAAMAAFDDFGVEAVFARNRELTDLLASSIADVGWRPITLPAVNRSTIVSVPIGDRDPGALVAALRERSVVAAVRDGHLRLSVHFYCHEEAIEHLRRVLAPL